MNLTQFQEQRLKDVQLDVRVMLPYLGERLAMADECGRDRVSITTGQLASVLNVLQFVDAISTALETPAD